MEIPPRSSFWKFGAVPHVFTSSALLPSARFCSQSSWHHGFLSVGQRRLAGFCRGHRCHLSPLRLQSCTIVFVRSCPVLSEFQSLFNEVSPFEFFFPFLLLYHLDICPLGDGRENYTAFITVILLQRLEWVLACGPNSTCPKRLLHHLLQGIIPPLHAFLSLLPKQ